MRDRGTVANKREQSVLAQPLPSVSNLAEGSTALQGGVEKEENWRLLPCGFVRKYRGGGRRPEVLKTNSAIFSTPLSRGDTSPIVLPHAGAEKVSIPKM